MVNHVSSAGWCRRPNGVKGDQEVCVWGRRYLWARDRNGKMSKFRGMGSFEHLDLALCPRWVVHRSRSPAHSISRRGDVARLSAFGRGIGHFSPTLLTTSPEQCRDGRRPALPGHRGAGATMAFPLLDDPEAVGEEDREEGEGDSAGDVDRFADPRVPAGTVQEHRGDDVDAEGGEQVAASAFHVQAKWNTKIIVV